MSHARSPLYSSDAALRDTPRTTSSDRRRLIRTATHGEPSRLHLITLILRTFAEMPGLSLHLHQAARLFGLRDSTCRIVLDDLVRDRRICRSADGRYYRDPGETLEHP
jgi:DNA-binding transcriptional LysR family regulator